MTKKKDILMLFEAHLWEELASSYSPNDLVNSLFFKDGMIVAYHLLYNDKWIDDLQNYAIEMFYLIRIFYSMEWNACWEYDALLGLACDITNKHDERYMAYKRAFDKANPIPPRLLIELARCCVCPGHPPISYDDAVNLVMEAINKVCYIDGVSLLCNIYSLKRDKEKQDYWTKTLEDLNSQGGVYSPSIEPKFLVEEYLEDLKRKKLQ